MSVDSCNTVCCADCKRAESSFWHKISGGALCTACYCQRDGLNQSTRSQGLGSVNSTATNKVADESRSLDNSTVVIKSASANTTRKSNRLKPVMKNRNWQGVAKPSLTKGRSRRYVFKKNVNTSCLFSV